MFHDRTKYFEVDLHFTRQIEDKSIRVDYVHTNNQLANLLTIALGKAKFENCRNKLNMKTVGSNGGTWNNATWDNQLKWRRILRFLKKICHNF